MPLADETLPATINSGFRLQFRVLESYGACPQKHDYQHIQLLNDRRDRGFVRFHGVLYTALTWAAEEAALRGVAPTLAEVVEILDARWDEAILVRNPYQAVYRERAKTVAERFLQRVGLLPHGVRLIMRPDLEVPIPGGVVVVTADEAEYHVPVGSELDAVASPNVIRFYKFGGRSDDHHRDDRILLLRSAGHEVIRLWYPLCNPEGQDVLAAEPQQTGVIERRLAKVTAQSAGLCQEDYTPRPRERECRRCGYKFNCSPMRDCCGD